MSALLVLWGGKDCGNYPPRAEICILENRIRTNGRLVRTIMIETPFVMGEEYANQLAGKLGITQVSHRIARNERISTWITRYDRDGSRPVRRIHRILSNDPSVLRIRIERMTNEPKKNKRKQA